MEIVVVIILLLVGLNFVLKLSYHNLIGRIVLCLVASIFLILTCDYAISQSKTQIADWLMQPDLMLDTSVILTVDVAFQICFCVLMALKLTGQIKRRQKIWFEICLWFPGLLIFPMLFSLLVEIIFSMPGTDFGVIAWSAAGAILILTPAIVFILKLSIPEDDLRLELMFIVNLLIAGLGIIATVNGRTAAVGTNEIDYSSLACILILFAIMAFAGYHLNKYITAKKITKIK